jgi:predicted alpha/beta hydrolase family esterase
MFVGWRCGHPQNAAMQPTLTEAAGERGRDGIDFAGGADRLAPGRSGPVVVPLIVPGWRDSGPAHWQSLWLGRLPGARRVVQDDWVHPSRDAWVGALARAVLEAPGPVVIVAHSLGCIAAVHLPAEAACRVQAALLVAPADPERRAVLHEFAPVPWQRLPYRSIVVASRTDPCCPSRLAGAYARAWGSEFVRLTDAGHINVESGHGEWPFGFALLHSLLAAVPASALRVAATGSAVVGSGL